PRAAEPTRKGLAQGARPGAAVGGCGRMNSLVLLLAVVQAPLLQQDGLRFRDLNRNGVLDPYEDFRLSPEQRARDLVARMTLEEKAGAMMHGTARTSGATGFAGMGGAYDT